jgi:hypothetical protein
MIKRKKPKPIKFKYARIGDVFTFFHKDAHDTSTPEFWVKVNGVGYASALKPDKTVLQIASVNQPVIVVDHNSGLPQLEKK